MTAPDERRDGRRRLVARARAAQRAIDGWTQAQVDELVTAAGWAIVEPARNRALAELAVRDTGLGNVADKIAKNRRKTMGLLRDLQGREVRRRHQRGSRARPGRDRAAGRRRRRDHAVDQSRRDAGEQHHQRAEGPQRDRRSRRRPRARRTLALLLEFVHAELDRVGAPRDLVQMLPLAGIARATRSS